LHLQHLKYINFDAASWPAKFVGYSSIQANMQAKVDGPGVVAALRRFWQRSYAAEYLGIILLLVANVWVCAMTLRTAL
jgi:hypothetical protein